MINILSHKFQDIFITKPIEFNKENSVEFLNKLEELKKQSNQEEAKFVQIFLIFNTLALSAP